jgi:hypothetical protein
MAGSRSFIAVLGAFAAGFLVAPAFAQEKPADNAARLEPSRRSFPRLGPEGEAERERVIHEIHKLSPEQRSEVWRVVWAVLAMPADKRRGILGFDEERRNRAREEIKSAMEASGIQLDEARKRAFMKRYFEERKAIEEQLRKESDEKRRQLVREMTERLRKEFGPDPTPAASPAGGTK